MHKCLIPFKCRSTQFASIVYGKSIQHVHDKSRVQRVYRRDMSERESFSLSPTVVSPEPPDSDEDKKEDEYQFHSPKILPRQRIPSTAPTSTDHDSALESADLLSHVDSTSSIAEKSTTNLISSLIVQPISNVVVTPTTPPQLGGLREALRSVQIRTLLYSCLVTVMASLSFGYGIGFSSPTLHDLDQNEGKHTYFRRTIYHDSFNVSN